MSEDLGALQKLEEVQKEARKYYSYEQAVKLTLNSIYGAFGNEHFFFYNVDIAETITLQGKDAILYSEELINKYFTHYWHNDTIAHEAMGVKVKVKVKDPVGIYIDTDSIVGNSTIRLSDGREISVKDLYNEGVEDMGSTLNGHESVSCKTGVLNWSKEKELYYVPVARVIRHKVSKKKWKLKTKSGKEIIVTNDHSMIVFRDGIQLEIKPSNISYTDKILTILKRSELLNEEYTIEEIDTIECIGDFDDEYVYDIEVDDDTHTFIANDILVHNSIYMKFEEVIESTDWEGDEKTFILKLYDARLKGFIEKIMQKYADDNNAENFLSFELESIAKNAIWLAKKNYMQNIVWHDPDLHYDELTKISAKGFDIIKGSAPLFAREKLKTLITFIFSKPKFQMKEFAEILKEMKREFKLANIDHICMSKNVNNYQKYILNDYEEFEFGLRCPMGVRAAGYHNYLLNNSEHKKKYQCVGNGEKLKIYHSTDKACDIFAYAPGDYPYEIAPPIDYDVQFEKTILDPINRVLKAMSYKGFNRNLIYVTGVF